MRMFWSLGSVFLLITIVLFQPAEPNPKIRISKKTTYVTEPLRSDGLPDYEAYLRKKLSQGITPENNAAPLLFQAVGASELEPDQYAAVVKDVGLKAAPPAESLLQPVNGDATRERITDWIRKTRSDKRKQDADDVIDQSMSYPWTSQDVPPLADWLDANKKPLDLIVVASRRPRYYAPSPTFLNDQYDMVVNLLLPGAQALRGGVHGLNLRVMRDIGENRLDYAWEDTKAIYRLSTLMAQGTTLVEQLLAISFRQIACHATEAILSSDRLTKELAHQIQKELSTISPFKNIASCVDQGERISMLDATSYSSIHGLDALVRAGFDKEISAIDCSSVDWNIVLAHINDQFDEAVAAIRLANFPERLKACKRFNAKLEMAAAKAKKTDAVKSELDRNARSELIGSILAALMVANLDAACEAEDRANSILTLTQLAAALAIYRNERGSYPIKIDDLVPVVLDKLPVDLFHNKPFIYKRADNGYLLYTIGVNDRDDAGSNGHMRILEGRYLDDLPREQADRLKEKIPAGADDFSTRSPCEPFALQKINR